MCKESNIIATKYNSLVTFPQKDVCGKFNYAATHYYIQ